MSTATQMVSETEEKNASETRERVTAQNEGEPERRRRVNPAVPAIVALVLVAVGTGWCLYARGFEDTDDAQVDGHLNPVSARVDGTIKAVYADDNQVVKAGEPVVVLDPKDYQVALDQAKAQYDQAMAQLSAAHPNLPMTQIANRSDLASQRAEVASAQAALAAANNDLATAAARLKESQALNERSQADFARYRALYEKEEVSRADYDQYKSAAAAQAQTVAANEAAWGSEQKIVEQRQAQLDQQKSKLSQTQSSAPLQLAIREADIKGQQANAEAAQAAYEKAQLNFGYAQVLAPVSGIVTQRSAEVGSRVSPGQQLLMIVQTDDLWVTANFKETQLRRMHQGQRVRIHVDSLGADFEGAVESMPPVTGSRTSVLPPENATGNYVKVIQRMPVRIRFNPNQKGLDKLRPGMSVEPKVYLD
jgi:membrane fusion protein, multidrug efflux system